MKRALLENWALFAAMMMLMVANGLLATLLTIRGAGLGFSDLTISLMQGAYPLGALIGTIVAPRLIEKVGHIRAFSALASLVSIAAIIHLLTGDPFSWSAMRFLGGFCYPGLYVITESWLNAKSENKIRAQVLSVYLVIQLVGPALGTAMVGLPDTSGNLLFAVVSILISLSIVPLLLSNNKAPDYEAPDRMPVKRLWIVSPMAVMGIVLMGVTISAWYISIPLYALGQGFSPARASGTLVIALTIAAVVQYPLGWLSDRTDRRLIVIGLALSGVVGSAWLWVDPTDIGLIGGFALIAVATSPVYGILVAHANDQLKSSQIVPASGTMVFLLNVGLLMGTLLGPNSISWFNGGGLPIVLGAICGFVAIWAIARRIREDAPEDTGEMQGMGVIGAASGGVMQAEAWVEAAEDDKAD
ncbi:MFS transporter [Halocynthiibacter namhaensis]|uniref:MFS transporter n=1 Tax=Halocynthiibacter namhaensis TaxID=1290553 RepID=UPI0005797AB0|nr:MFS transporter [Halocynthiibacter namhaensis]